MSILGVDPGLNTTGYGLIEVRGGTVALKEGGTITSGPSSTPIEQRLASLYSGVQEVLAEHRPEAMALEQVYSHYRYPATAMIMGHARGVIALAAALAKVPVFSYTSTQVKLAISGNGSATKVQIQRSIQARLGLDRPPEPNDVADALALAICHWQMATGAGQVLNAQGGAPRSAARRNRP